MTNGTVEEGEGERIDSENRTRISSPFTFPRVHFWNVPPDSSDVRRCEVGSEISARKLRSPNVDGVEERVPVVPCGTVNYVTSRHIATDSGLTPGGFSKLQQYPPTSCPFVPQNKRSPLAPAAGNLEGFVAS